MMMMMMMIEIAVKNATLCGKICDMRNLLKYTKNAAMIKQNMWQSHIRIKLTFY